MGREKDTCEKCERKRERHIETLKHALIECQEYKEERKNFESEIIRKMGNREWEEINRVKIRV